MSQVPRERFVTAGDVSDAHGDHPLPIGFGQTISQPFTVAFMCESIGPQPTDRALEIGSGSGYGAAVLSRLVQHVDTVERIPQLAAAAEQKLQLLGYDNVTVHVGDGCRGLSSSAPFDIIVVTAAAEEIPPALTEQLADGGRLIIPVGSPVTGQSMTLLTRSGNHLHSKNLGSFSFVPLVGAEKTP